MACFPHSFATVTEARGQVDQTVAALGAPGRPPFDPFDGKLSQMHIRMFASEHSGLDRKQLAQQLLGFGVPPLIRECQPVCARRS
jgi:hypothetical protein